MEELQVKVGDVVASKYRVEKVLGAGGMGVVVAARHVALGSLVAIKIMLPRAFAVKGAAERFLREGQAAAQLASPHVAKVLDVGQLDSGPPYMIMEHLSGSDLASVIEKRGAVPLSDAVEYILQACDAIGEAHGKGIVHRDLKPANLFLQTAPDGAPLIKVLDFGIAKVAGSDQKLTGTSQGMGSGGYMSPEQMSSAKKVDHRADIWALGITLYELVTAHLPFAADSLEQFVARVFFEQPTPLLQHRPELPPSLEPVILQCLDKQADGRYPTVAHLAAALAAFAPPRALPYVDRIARHVGVTVTATPAQAASKAGTMLLQAYPSAPAGGQGPAAQSAPQAPQAGPGRVSGAPMMAPTPGMPSQPMLAQPGQGMPSQPMLAPPGQGMPSQPVIAQPGPGMPSQPVIAQTGPGMGNSAPGFGQTVPGAGGPPLGQSSGAMLAPTGVMASPAGLSASASLPSLSAQPAPAAPPSKKTGLFVGIGAVAVIGILALVGLRFTGGASSSGSTDTAAGSGTTAAGSGTNGPGATTTTTAVTTAGPAQTTTATTSTVEPQTPPSGTPVVPTSKPAVPGKVPPSKSTPSAEPASKPIAGPISKDRNP